MSYLGVGISPGNVPVSHSINAKVADRRVRVVELVLRCVICGLGVLGRRWRQFQGKGNDVVIPL